MLIETGSRTLAIVHVASSIYEAEQYVEKNISNIKGPLFHRSDIGTKDVIDKKTIRMDKLRC